MKTDSIPPKSRHPRPDTETSTFEPILDDKLSRFLDRMDSELAKSSRLDVAE